MRFLDWIKGAGNDDNAQRDSVPKRPSLDAVPFRFQRPFDYMHNVMSPDERKIVDAVEARWRERYEQFRNYPPMSEGQEHERAVFHAVDGIHNAMHARETAPYGDWKALEANVEKAFAEVRFAFTEQRRFVEHECDKSWER